MPEQNKQSFSIFLLGNVCDILIQISLNCVHKVLTDSELSLVHVMTRHQISTNQTITWTNDDLGPDSI